MTCAGTVVAPRSEASAGIVSVTSMSRSVALSRRPPSSARRSTLPRMGIVLRRSTTRCTCPSAFRSAARSTVTFIGRPVEMRASPGRSYAWVPVRRARTLAKPCAERKAFARRSGLLLQHALQKLDLVAERGVVGKRLFDLAHRVQNGRVVAAAEAPADLRQGAQGQNLRQIHGDLPRAHHRCRATL